MMLMKLPLPPFLSGCLFTKSHAGVAQPRHCYADRLEAVPPLSGSGTQGGDARLAGQTWHLRLGWRQRLRQWGVRHCCGGGQRIVPQRLDEPWDALHERVRAPTTEGLLDCMARTHPSLRLVIYTSLT
jgi:hypothetical protein